MQTPDVYNYNHLIRQAANSESCVRCFSFFPVSTSHVSFQSAVSAANGCCLLDCLCVTSHVSAWGEGICYHKRMKLSGETKFLPNPAIRTKEPKKILMLLCRQHLLSFWYKWTKGSKIVIWIMPFISRWFLVKQFSPSLSWMFFSLPVCISEQAP